MVDELLFAIIQRVTLLGECLRPAVIVTAIVRVHPVHLMNVGQRQAAADLQIVSVLLS